MRAKHRTMDTEVVTKQAHMERAAQRALVAQVEGDLLELKEKLAFSERCNNFADLRYSLLVD